MNQARAEINADLTGSTHIYGYGSFDSYWYEREAFENVNGIQMGAGLNQQITSWLTLSTSYSRYLNDVDERLRDYQIHRVEIGRFRFNLSPHTEIFFSGGIEVADTRGQFETDAMIRAGISRSSETTELYANYQRTMTSALGFQRILPSHVFTLGYGHRYTPRTMFRVAGTYLRSSDYEQPGTLQGAGVQAQLEYALRPDLFASVSYGYQYQKNTIPDLANLPHFDRSAVLVSLQYVWPSIRLRSE